MIHGFLGFWVSGFQGFRVSGFQGFRVHGKVKGFGVRARALGVYDLGFASGLSEFMWF